MLKIRHSNRISQLSSLRKIDDHRSDHRFIRKIAVLGGLTLIFGALSLYGLSRNGHGAVARYNTLIAADQSGGDVEKALNDLRTYIYSHMNSEIGGPNGIYPPIQLSGTYSRLVDAEQKRVETINGELYQKAQQFCEENGSQGFSGRNRLDCINAYVDQNGAKPQKIDEALYKYDFVSPRWSADLAGISIVFLVLFFVATLLQIIMYLHTKHLVRVAN